MVTMATTTPGVSVIISNYNGWALLQQALPTVLAQDYQPLEIMVVDDASTDDSAAQIAAHYPQVRVLALQENKGFAGANNAAVATAQYDWIFLLNNDIQLPAVTVSILIQQALARPQVAVLGPAIHNLNMDMDRYPKNGTLSLTGTMIQNVFEDRALVFGISGCAVLFDRSRLGLPFDEDYQFFHEDVFLSWKGRLMGLGILQVPEVTVQHKGEATLKARGETNRFLMERNRRLNWLTFFSRASRCKIWPLLMLAGLVERWADISKHRSAAPLRQARTWVHKHRTLIRQKRAAVQAWRRVPDREIIRYMSGKITNYSGRSGRWLNRLALGWCWLAGLKTWEFQSKK
jgi:hypothetical protein